MNTAPHKSRFIRSVYESITNNSFFHSRKVTSNRLLWREEAPLPDIRVLKMAESVLYFVLNELSVFLHEEGSQLGRLRREVQLIRDELEHMRAFLKVAEAREEDDPRLQVWIKQVREVAYDIEDVLDEFVHRFAYHRAHGLYGSFRRIFNSIKSLRACHRVAGEIQNIKARIKNISKGHQRYQLDEYGFLTQVSGSLAVVNNNTWHHSRDNALLVEEAELIGIEKPKQHLISQLLEDDHSQLKVISLVGMGGLGKTTLVKKVHEDINVRRHFPVRAWVTVSQSRDFRELLKNLIQQLHEKIKKPVPPIIDSMNSIVKLKEFINDFLQEAERYAIVFDDVWHVEFWNEIKFALPKNCCGNRVILTTRKADVASASCIESHVVIYKMKPLSFEESWILFCNKTFKDNCCPNHLNDVAESMLRKCEGLPLAILAISGLLALKDVNRVDEWKLVQHSLGGELEGTGKLDRVKRILCLSYNDLPSHLKNCLLYISIFPEDHEINCYQLIHLWIAERFVEWREGISFEDLAWGYLKELVNRSLLQVTRVFYEGIPLSCRIHDLLREVIISKSREQNMVTIATGQHMITWQPEKVRRLVIYNNFLPNCDDRSQESYYSFNHLRSLITLFDSVESSLNFKNLFAKVLSTSSGKLLKVLDLGNARMLDKIPNEVFNLFRLSYLNFNRTGIETIPKYIGKLQNLEYLNLGNTKVRELHMEILKLKKLRHLIIYQEVNSGDTDHGYIGFKALSKMGGLLSLCTIDTIDVAENKETKIVEEIGKLTQLRELDITNLRIEDGKELCSSLVNLTSLQELSVASTKKDDDYEAIDLNHHHSVSAFSSSSFLQSLCFLSLRGRLEKMPQWITRLQSLVRIRLIWSKLRDDEEDPLESLQHLPNLAHVYLSQQAYQGKELCFKAEGFPKLKVLNLRKLQGLRWMRVEEGAMPRLQQLILQELPLLEDLPLGIQHLTQLQELKLSSMSSELVEKLENQNKESEDYKRTIAHIPEITISIWTGREWRRRQLWGEEKKT